MTPSPYVATHDRTLTRSMFAAVITLLIPAAVLAARLGMVGPAHDRVRAARLLADGSVEVSYLYARDDAPRQRARLHAVIRPALLRSSAETDVLLRSADVIEESFRCR